MKHFFTTLALVASLSTPAPASAETVRFFHHDANGNLRLKTDATGVVVWESEPSPFGAYTTHTPGSPQRFLDQPQEDNGLIELGARFYDPNIGRFISADPAPLTTHELSNPQSCNRFAYALNNPYRFEDGSGTIPVETVLDVLDVGWSAYDLINDPSWTNAGFLAWSVGAVFVPYGPGAWVTKGPLKFADYLPGVTKEALEHVDDLARAAKGSGSAFGGLSRAAEFGVQPYNQLTRALKGTRLQAHHLLEKRFAGVLGQKTRQMASVAVTKAEHQAFTNAWRAAIPHGKGTANATKQHVVDAAKQIYSGHPELLRALGL